MEIPALNLFDSCISVLCTCLKVEDVNGWYTSQNKQLCRKRHITEFDLPSNHCDCLNLYFDTKLKQSTYIIQWNFLYFKSYLSQVLYAELKLPPNGDPRQVNTTFRKTLGARGRLKLPKHFSTSKDALEKLKPFHQLPAIILEWRRITAAITKVNLRLKEFFQTNFNFKGPFCDPQPYPPNLLSYLHIYMYTDVRHSDHSWCVYVCIYSMYVGGVCG